MTRLLRVAGASLAALVLALTLYALAALILGLLPRNPTFAETPDGIPVIVRTNGVHADIVVPAKTAAVDWTLEFPATDMAGLAAPTDWIAFGWGDKGFMLTTPTWADLRPGTALIALSGLGEGVMHVEYVDSPLAYHARTVRVSIAQYERLIAAIRAAFLRDRQGRVVRVSAPGYFETDAFYEAVPRYTFWFTCNEWTRRVLSSAGIRTAHWAPFDTAIFAHLPASPR